MVLIVGCAVAVVMQYNGQAIAEDVVDVVVLGELWIGGLASNSSSIEMVHISSWELASGSGPRRSVSDSPLLSEIISFSKRLFSFTINLAVHDL